MVLLSACASKPMVSQSPVARAVVIQQNYATELAAVVAAANQFNPLSIAEDREYMGAIYECSEGFVYSVGAGKVAAGNVSVILNTPAGCDMVALWHTHGAEHYSHRFFSGIDTRLVERVGMPFYMADYTGALRVFNPGDRTLSLTRARQMGLGEDRDYAEGSRIQNTAGNQIQVATR
ncbi:DUF4329 domain-containing protein [Halioxenophilus sp. WMMB6]|uniref:DUF4329 domain-containing protein n=1 Tax=Halioxenophilus sp. WMMB6 TaxID=3073815 RepID=UPI00295F41D2|nr:DUF4329 domain-containing protein [Halioxenophilus sp. WMMB6]